MESHELNIKLSYLLCKDIYFVLDKTEFVNIIYKTERKILMMNKEIVYIAELDADVDDVVAAHYLHNKGVLKCVVLDPYPKTKDGIKRKEQLENLGVTVLKKCRRLQNMFSLAEH